VGLTPGASRSLRCFFEPGSIAVAGVSSDPNKLGSIIYTNLLSNVSRGTLKANVYALNPSHTVLFGRPCFARVRSLPETPDLLIIAVPVSLALGLVTEAADAGVAGAILITSGYAEAGRRDLEQEIGRIASRKGMRILGPNTIGLLDTRSGVDSLFLRPSKPIPRGGEIISLLPPLKGDMVIITQSGHLGEIISEELASNGIGIRALVGTGNQLDVSVEDVIEYFADDPHTKSIALYIEGLRDGRRFLTTAARAVKRKPLIVYKVGKTETGARAARTHTASLVGDYEVYRAAFRQAGIVEARNLQELFDYCVSFSMLPQCTGDRLAIVTNAGGVGVVAADEAEEAGLQVRPLEESLERELHSRFGDRGFISNASLGNPIDLTATVSTGEFASVVQAVLRMRSVDLALVLPTHQTPAMDYDLAARLSEVVLDSRKPVCMCVMGHSDFAEKIHGDFTKKGIPDFPTPERAVRALAALSGYHSRRHAAHSPSLLGKAERTATAALESGRTREKVEDLLKECGIHEPVSRMVKSIHELRDFEIGFPAACKLVSKDLSHKSDVGGVILDVQGLEGLASAFERLRAIAKRRGIRFEGMLVQEMVKGGMEAILGGTRDATFGPVVIFGLGGIFTELSKEFELSIAPIGPTEAKDMIRRTKLSRGLDGFRGRTKVNVEMLSRTVSRFSRMLVDYPSMAEIEVNPLILIGDRFFVVDSRFVLDPKSSKTPANQRK
jgi:acetyltransferase